MPQTRRLIGFARRYYYFNILYSVLGIGCFYIFWRSARMSRMDLLFWCGLTGFLICVFAGIVWDIFRLRRATCPECGDRMPCQPRERGKPVAYACIRCDIVWESGLTESDG